MKNNVQRSRKKEPTKNTKSNIIYHITYKYSTSLFFSFLITSHCIIYTLNRELSQFAPCNNEVRRRNGEMCILSLCMGFCIVSSLLSLLPLMLFSSSSSWVFRQLPIVYNFTKMLTMFHRICCQLTIKSTSAYVRHKALHVRTASKKRLLLNLIQSNIFSIWIMCNTMDGYSFQLTNSLQWR